MAATDSAPAPHSPTNRAPVAIVGAGLAGLTCARRLHAAGVDARIFEAGDAVGGRVRTDEVDGHRIDRGFQVLLTAYPEAKAQLDYGKLDLRAFEPGALVHRGERTHRIADPIRRPGSLWATMRAPIASLADKLRIGRLRLSLGRADLDELLRRPAQSTRARLAKLGLSDGFVDAFFRPFYGGVLLDRELATSSRMFDYTFACFTRGDAVVPAGGMQKIPEQLAAGLPDDAVQLGCPVAHADRDHIVLSSGERVAASAVVIATDGTDAAGLLGDAGPGDMPSWKATTLMVYSLPRGALRLPKGRPTSIVLNGDADGPIDHYCVPSAIADGYAPTDRDVLYATALDRPNAGGGAVETSDREQLEQRALAQLERWHGPGVREWRHLRTQRIERALPDLAADDQADIERSVVRPDGRFVCGDHRDAPSIQGAMRSGRRAAEAVLAKQPTVTSAS
ncbi:MAG: NAD(P)/FAD-dependent oxidoreductase [Planctomycetota bacterium]